MRSPLPDVLGAAEKPISRPAGFRDLGLPKLNLAPPSHLHPLSRASAAALSITDLRSRRPQNWNWNLPAAIYESPCSHPSVTCHSSLCQ
ncbi:hypothetical protein AAFF_G00008300 [Aldrovandia affinis]|uniref:Uncharacterized protein n=1 Tax=Aldrovandia affinis TaxID=143900 RepID=A0AAD7T790_9TELE|nr:hypothetical protein AAFF_G00008300 [Aldrovandia affinis]